MATMTNEDFNTFRTERAAILRKTNSVKAQAIRLGKKYLTETKGIDIAHMEKNWQNFKVSERSIYGQGPISFTMNDVETGRTRYNYQVPRSAIFPKA